MRTWFFVNWFSPCLIPRRQGIKLGTTLDDNLASPFQENQAELQPGSEFLLNTCQHQSCHRFVETFHHTKTTQRALMKCVRRPPRNLNLLLGGFLQI